MRNFLIHDYHNVEDDSQEIQNSIFFDFFLAHLKSFPYFCSRNPKGVHRLIETTKRYARLANGNVRNFYKMQGQ